jgi:hypothetical protein
MCIAAELVPLAEGSGKARRLIGAAMADVKA